MQTTNRLEIHFHQQDQASVFLENSVAGREEERTELLLFALYALRQLSNLGNSPEGAGLAEVLMMTEDVITDLAAGHDAGGVRLVTYAGSPGRKRFVASLQMNGAQSRFVCDGKGFGLFSRGAGFYSPTSVVVLLRFLAEKRSEHEGFLEKLTRIATMCGGAFLAGQVSLTNQNQLAMMVLQAAEEETA